MEFEGARRLLLLDFLRQRHECRGLAWFGASSIDRTLPDIPGGLPTVRRLRDQLEQFRDDYALVVAFAAHVCGVTVQELCPFHLLKYLLREGPLKEGPKEADP